MKEYRAARDRGQRTFINSDTAKQHVQQLHKWGLPLNTIARLAGVGHERIHDLYRGEGDMIQMRVHLGVMSVTHRPTAAGVMVLSVGAIRRIRALHALGFSQSQIERECGLPRTKASHIRGDYCRWETWKCVKDGYDRLSMSRGDSVRSVNRAKAMGWPSPLDWETADIDHPDSWPDDAVSVRVLEADRRELGCRMLADGVPRKKICEVLGVSGRTVDRWAVL